MKNNVLFTGFRAAYSEFLQITNLRTRSSIYKWQHLIIPDTESKNLDTLTAYFCSLAQSYLFWLWVTPVHANSAHKVPVCLHPNRDVNTQTFKLWDHRVINWVTNFPRVFCLFVFIRCYFNTGPLTNGLNLKIDTWHDLLPSVFEQQVSACVFPNSCCDTAVQRVQENCKHIIYWDLAAWKWHLNFVKLKICLFRFMKTSRNFPKIKLLAVSTQLMRWLIFP